MSASCGSRRTVEMPERRASGCSVKSESQYVARSSRRPCGGRHHGRPRRAVFTPARHIRATGFPKLRGIGPVNGAGQAGRRPDHTSHGEIISPRPAAAGAEACGLSSLLPFESPGRPARLPPDGSKNPLAACRPRAHSVGGSRVPSGPRSRLRSLIERSYRAQSSVMRSCRIISVAPSRSSCSSVRSPASTRRRA